MHGLEDGHWFMKKYSKFITDLISRRLRLWAPSSCIWNSTMDWECYCGSSIIICWIVFDTRMILPNWAYSNPWHWVVCYNLGWYASLRHFFAVFQTLELMIIAGIFSLCCLLLTVYLIVREKEWHLNYWDGHV
jgi:hypothetical protein